MTMLRRICRTIRLTTACAATILVVVLAGCGEDGGSRSSLQPDPHVSSANVVRTVSIFDHMPAPSVSATELSAWLEKGALPDGTVHATVLTDENCEPDAQGISHCRNRVRLASGRKVVLRHPHDMNQVPCLNPGEKVLLRRV